MYYHKPFSLLHGNDSFREIFTRMIFRCDSHSIIVFERIKPIHNFFFRSLVKSSHQLGTLE